MLVVYADGAAHQLPRDGETYDLEDVRKDEECTDTVGIFLKVNADNSSRFRVALGPQVQTLTKAMTSHPLQRPGRDHASGNSRRSG